MYAGMPLQQLHLEHCDLQDGAEGLAAALLLLPKLQHLCIRQCYDRSEDTFKPWVVMSSDVLYSLQQLTYLELTYCPLQDWHGLRHLTALQDLSLVLSSSNLTGSRQTCIIDGGALSGAQHLTCLQLHSADADVVIHPAVLAGRTALQHLSLYCSMDGGSGGATELLSHLQHLQQLTYLDLNFTLKAIAPAAAYSALTASSNLRGLDVRDCTVPAGTWQHVFPSGRQLPHLVLLHVGEVHTPKGPAAAPEGSRLVSFCPGLLSLNLQQLQYSSDLLAPLTGLGSLLQLSLLPSNDTAEGLEVVCELAGLKWLDLIDAPVGAGEQLLQLTQLHQLTYLNYLGVVDGQHCEE
jgi:Leucine-rich repeat (LRR) protein